MVCNIHSKTIQTHCFTSSRLKLLALLVVTIEGFACPSIHNSTENEPSCRHISLSRKLQRIFFTGLQPYLLVKIRYSDLLGLRVSSQCRTRLGLPRFWMIDHLFERNIVQNIYTSYLEHTSKLFPLVDMTIFELYSCLKQNPGMTTVFLTRQGACVSKLISSIAIVVVIGDHHVHHYYRLTSCQCHGKLDENNARLD